MSDHVYKMIDMVGFSQKSIEDAVQTAIAKAAVEDKNLRWLEIKEIRGHIEGSTLDHWQVRVSIGAIREERPQTATKQAARS